MRFGGTARASSVVLGAAIVLTACAGSATTADIDAAPVAAAGTVAPSTAPTTTVSPTTIVSTVAPSTTAPTTAPTTAVPTTPAPTTVAPAPDDAVDDGPIDPPLDADADEPVIELGTISIPGIDVSMTMYEGIRLSTLDRGPGHWPGSAMPGETGNVVVGGHRVSGHGVFRDVDRLEPGDEIVFEDGEHRHVYEVRDVQIIDPYDVWIVDPTDTPTATLFACHPPGSTAQRIAVFADLVSG